MFTRDIPSLNSRLTPWSEDAFAGAQLSCLLTQQRRNGYPRTDPPNRSSSQGSTLPFQLKKSVPSWRNRIITRQTHLPATFIRIHLSKPEDSIQLLQGGFFMHYFHYRVEKANPPTIVKHGFKCQEFNNISTQYNNPVKCLRCGENHHHKACLNNNKICTRVHNVGVGTLQPQRAAPAT